MATTEMNCLASGGGSVQVETGTISITSSVRSFDCGINDPDIVLAKMDRNDNDWSWTYLKAGALDYDYGINTGAIQNGTVDTSNRISVSGSTVTLSGTGGWANTKWVAIKF